MPDIDEPTLLVLPQPKGGRSKLKPEVVNAICAGLRDGATREAACKAAGINPHTLPEWERSYPAVAAAIQKAEGDMVLTAVGIIAEAARNGNWQAAAWLVERRYPQNYGRRTIVAGDEEQAQSVRFTLNIGGDKAEAAGQ